LRERVRSYFGETSLKRPPKLRRLLAEITRLEWHECGSELEALLLERRLIAERKPILNHQHKRFEIYPYLLLSAEDFPRLTLTRAEPVADLGIAEELSDELAEMNARDRSTLPVYPPSANLPLETLPHPGELPGLYLGPFTTPRAARWTLEAVRVLFPLRTCEGTIRPDANGRACFYGEIGRCCAPCVGTTPQEEYSRLCADLVRLLETGEAEQLDVLRTRMQRLAEEWRFEDAAVIKEQLQAVEIVAARLRRLRRMRENNNVIIAQPARPPTDGSQTETKINVFLVRCGSVRRHLLIDDWNVLREVVREVYCAETTVAEFTAKAELDEMMILDRWLQAHGDESCCVWMNELSSRQWLSSTVRKLQKWTQANP
jgi:excinuclease ABC subunit C